MIEGTFIETNEQYHRGFALDDYQGTVSLVGTEQGKDGKIYMQWVYPQRTKDGTRGPGEKSIPLKIELGTHGQAVNRLETILAALRGGVAADGKAADDDPGIPF